MSSGEMAASMGKEVQSSKLSVHLKGRRVVRGPRLRGGERIVGERAPAEYKRHNRLGEVGSRQCRRVVIEGLGAS